MTTDDKKPTPVADALAAYKEKLDTFKKRIDNLPEEVPLEDTALTEQITAGITELRNLKRDIEAQQKTLQKPWQDRVNQIRASFKPLATLCDVHRAYLTGLLDDWRQRDEKVKKEAAEKLREEAEKQADSTSVEDIEAAAAKQAEADALTESAGKVRSMDGASSYTRTLWDGEVTDKMALIKAVAAGELPSDWLEVKMPEVRKSIRDMELREAPGLRIFSTTTTHTR